MSTEVRKIEGWSVELDIDPDRFTFYPGVEQPNFPPPQYTVTPAVLVVGSKVVKTEEEAMRLMLLAYECEDFTALKRLAQDNGITL